MSDRKSNPAASDCNDRRVRDQPGAVLPDAQLRDLGIDSLDLTEIAAGVDEDFDVEVTGGHR